MRDRTVARFTGIIALVVMSCVGITGCSDSKSDDETLAPDSGEDKDGAKAAKVAEPAPDEAALAAAAAAEAEKKAAAAKAAEPAPAPVAAAPAPAPAPVATNPVDKTRVVRYVNDEQVELRASPADNAASAGHLLKGERILVIEENGWGRIADGMFIKLDSLSKKAVPRDRQAAPWQAPAH